MGSRTNQLIDLLRNRCLMKGCGGLKELSVVFRHMDIDYSKRICFEELREAMKNFGLSVNEQELRSIFDVFDRDNNNTIDFCEFMHQLRPSMNEIRVRVCNEAFDKLDVNNDGVIKTDDLKVVYSDNIQKHPKYISGEMTEEEVLRAFLDSIDTPGCPDGKVTREEFLNYYSGVSATVDDDCYFDLMMRSCYGLADRKVTR